MNLKRAWNVNTVIFFPWHLLDDLYILLFIFHFTLFPPETSVNMNLFDLDGWEVNEKHPPGKNANFTIKLLLPKHNFSNKSKWVRFPVHWTCCGEWISTWHLAKIIQENLRRKKSPSQIATSNLQLQHSLRQKAQNDALFAERSLVDFAISSTQQQRGRRLSPFPYSKLLLPGKMPQKFSASSFFLSSSLSFELKRAKATGERNETWERNAHKSAAKCVCFRPDWIAIGYTEGVCRCELFN